MPEETKESFLTPQVPTNLTSWGPPTTSTSTSTTPFDSLPYAPFGRSDRLGRAADFTSFGSQTLHRQRIDRRFDHVHSNTEFQYKVQQDDFELVDTAKSVKNTSSSRSFSNYKKQRNLRNLNARRSDRGGNGGGGLEAKFSSRRGGGRGAATGRGGRGGGRGGRGGRGGGQWRDRIDRQASVSVRADWNLLQDVDLNKLTKGVTNTSKPITEKDLYWCGFLDRYNDLYEQCSTRTPAVLKRSENKEFYPVTTLDDPVIEKLAIEGKGNVFATDAILAHLMTCSRSVYPWDIVVVKLGNGAIFFDKRDDSQFDYLTVNETANAPPSPQKAEDDPEGINTPERLSLEATMIHQNFTQQILKSGGGGANRKHFELPNPFFDEEENDGMEPASVAYRYRRFDLGEEIELVCRTELHGMVKRKVPGSATMEDQYMTAFALNEHFDSMSPYSKTNVPSAGMINWREKLDSQRGAVLATELKNNAFKLAKWTAQSILADADQMKIGFVSRTVPRNNYEHQILATQFYRPKDFATQITLKEGSMWGIMRMLINLFREQPEGKYVIMRDPNKAVLKFYSVPQETFEDSDEE